MWYPIWRYDVEPAQFHCSEGHLPHCHGSFRTGAGLRKRRRVKRALVTLVVLIVLGAAGWLYRRHVVAQPPATPAEVPLISVSTAPVQVMPVTDSIAAYGNLVALRTVNIAPETSGVVKAILFTDGQFVTAGMPLVQMDATTVKAQLESARAQAATDVQNLHRIELLASKGLNSTSSLEEAQARAAASQAQVVIAEQRLAQTTLRAPFDGRLGIRQVDAGAFVPSGSTIVQLEDTTDLQIEFRLPSGVAVHLTEGMPVHIAVPGTHQSITGKLSFIDPTVSTDTRSVLLRALVHNPGPDVRPGLFVRVTVNLATNPDALVVPFDAVITELGSSYVYVVGKDHIVHRQTVTLGLADGSVQQLLSGVKQGERVVTVGQFRMHDGVRVKVVPDAQDATNAG